MGEIVNVIERPSSRPGIVRFETNRALSGMGHDRYLAGEAIEDNRPTDELARRIFARGGIASVHINGSVITVDLQKGYSGDGIADIVRSLFTFYVATPMDAADTVAAEAAVVAAPDEAAAADAPVLQDIAAAEAAGVERPVDPGIEVAARNEEIAAEAEAAAAAKDAEAPEPEAEAEEPAAEEPAAAPDATDADTDGHGEVTADTADAPNEAPTDAEPAADAES